MEIYRVLWFSRGREETFDKLAHGGGGADFNSNEANILRQAVKVCGFTDLGFIGHEFTWSTNKGEAENVQERLDQFFTNEVQRSFFPGSYFSHLTKQRSDHLPILIIMKATPTVENKRRRRKIFRFEEMWTRDEFSGVIISNAWKQQGDIKAKLSHTVSQLARCSKSTFGKFAKETRECRNLMSN
ncbi:Sulfotransferase family cytosolic 1B member 1 [Bienertia sinuspersici]